MGSLAKRTSCFEYVLFCLSNVPIAELGLVTYMKHKFKNNFQDTLKPLCTCGCDFENTCHFLFYCPNFLAERNTLLNKITNIDSNILNQAGATITKALQFDNTKCSNKVNLKILNVSIDFILTAK